MLPPYLVDGLKVKIGEPLNSEEYNTTLNTLNAECDPAKRAWAGEQLANITSKLAE